MVASRMLTVFVYLFERAEKKRGQITKNQDYPRKTSGHLVYKKYTKVRFYFHFRFLGYQIMSNVKQS